MLKFFVDVVLGSLFWAAILLLGNYLFGGDWNFRSMFWVALPSVLIVKLIVSATNTRKY